jgi:hypothetical protein
MAYISFQPKDYFNTKLYTGNASTNAITGVGFQPDFTWIKQRSATRSHMLFDAIRGATYRLSSDTTEANGQYSTSLTAFNTDGFTLGAFNDVNASSGTFASWNWKANGAGSANTDGSISSTVSANTTAGFSIVKFTGTASNNTVGHGLSTAPRVIIAKNLGTTQNWFVYHQDIQSSNADGYINLNTTDATSDSSTVWQATAPTSSVFSVGTSVSAHDYIAYCFAEKKGFSKFGSYTGNGNADGTFVYTGFKPAFVLQKRSSSTESWQITDSVRDKDVSPNFARLMPNSANAESTNTTWAKIEKFSNGFKLGGTDTVSNGSGSTYIYMAFAEEPLVASNGIPATAR